VPCPSKQVTEPLDERADELIARATAKEPAKRHPDVQSFMYELRALMGMLGMDQQRRRALAPEAARERRELDHRLKAEAEVFGAVPLPMASCDAAGRVRAANPAFLEFLGAAGDAGGSSSATPRSPTSTRPSSKISRPSPPSAARSSASSTSARAATARSKRDRPLGRAPRRRGHRRRSAHRSCTRSARSRRRSEAEGEADGEVGADAVVEDGGAEVVGHGDRADDGEVGDEGDGAADALVVAEAGADEERPCATMSVSMPSSSCRA